jgi:glutamyl-tRNA synthetase
MALATYGGGAAWAAARDSLEALDPWTTAAIEETLRGLPPLLGQKPKQLFQIVRVAVAGSTVSPPLFESLELMGRERTLARLDAAQTMAAP